MKSTFTKHNFCLTGTQCHWQDPIRPQLCTRETQCNLDLLPQTVNTQSHSPYASDSEGTEPATHAAGQQCELHQDTADDDYLPGQAEDTTSTDDDSEVER